jgi:outer membrane PBP1 activator LpoA protein
MSIQSSGGTHQSDSVIPFAPKNAAPDNADQLDNAGQTILKLLHKAADVAEANSKHALDMAQKLSHQLRSAEDRIAELEAEVQLYQEKCERAERWLHKVYTEIEDRFAGRRPWRCDWRPATPCGTQDVKDSCPLQMKG